MAVNRVRISCLSIILIIAPLWRYNRIMIDQVGEWAKRLGKQQISAELLNTMYGMPQYECDTIMTAVSSPDDSVMKFCSDSIVECSVALYEDSQFHLAAIADSLLALVPTFASTFDDFCPTRSRGDKYLVQHAFASVLQDISAKHDLPSNFLFNAELEQHLMDDLHGMMITQLAGDHHETVDLEWLASNRENLAPYADTLYEHGRADKDFCSRLLEQKSPSLSAGTL